MKPSLQAQVANLTEACKLHVVARDETLARTPRRTDDFDPHRPHEHPHEEIAAEIASLRGIIAMLESARSEADLISAYDEAKSLHSRIIEFPGTAGRNAAHLYVFPRLRDLLDQCGIDPNPMTPRAGPAARREA